MPFTSQTEWVYSLQDVGPCPWARACS